VGRLDRPGVEGNRTVVPADWSVPAEPGLRGASALKTGGWFGDWHGAVALALCGPANLLVLKYDVIENSTEVRHGARASKTHHPALRNSRIRNIKNGSSRIELATDRNHRTHRTQKRGEGLLFKVGARDPARPFLRFLGTHTVQCA